MEEAEERQGGGMREKEIREETEERKTESEERRKRKEVKNE